ncbi:PH domain-containing protein [Solicola gregarius]|uniref:PH domain-containing protein n=1 Tax=Solicola gregarius TaxID=2908642 RepID=A0AA46TJ08_9ACTN|nr:PH domain-containing protein [Solicola gregarius]UYM05764.1 PH domain-containing protein [Solicola gregarius]
MALVSSTEARRTHPASPLVRAWLWLLATLAWSANAVLQDEPITLIGGVIVGAILLGLAAGYVAWAFTYFVIDGAELRIESGVFVKRSRRMPYERIQSVDIAQPFGARLFGLAELRIEMAGGEESRTQLRFLALDEARGLRQTLLERTASDVPFTPEEPAGTQRPDRLVTAVPNGRVIVAALLTSELITAIVVTCALLGALAVNLAATALFGSDGFVATSLPLLLGIGGWLFTLVRSRVFEQWGFRLSYASRGLHIERGLFNRISQTVPLDRVQGVVVEQPLLWRPFGWYRMRVDTAGYTRGGDVKNDDSTSSVLPVGELATVRLVLSAMLPDREPLRVPLIAAPRRSAWFAPIGWRFRAVGYDERVIVVTRGWITHRIDVVPHAKTQSVRITQGPLQRRLALADLVIDTTKGPVDAHAYSRDATEVRELAMSQLDRARTSRRLA